MVEMDTERVQSFCASSRKGEVSVTGREFLALHSWKSRYGLILEPADDRHCHPPSSFESSKGERVLYWFLRCYKSTESSQAIQKSQIGKV